MTHDEALEVLQLTEEEAMDLDLVKERYRRLAQQHHPDKGGKTEIFQLIKAAYEFLTGVKKPDNSRAQMLERLAGLFMAAVEGASAGGGNPVEMVKSACLRVQHDLRSNIAQTAAAIRKREDVLKKLRSKKPGVTILQDFLRRDIARHKLSIASLEAEIPKAQEIIDFLQDYDYENEFETHTAASFQKSYRLGLLGDWSA